MAAPAEMTTLNLSGVFVMNKPMGDSVEEVLSLQGVGWLNRKAILLATITLYVKHNKDEHGVENIVIKQTLTGGIPGTTEERILDWTERPHEDHIFGVCLGKSRRVMLKDVEDDFLKKDWTADTIEHGLIQAYVYSDTTKNKNTWITDQTWGFQDIKDERRYVRRLKFTGPKGQKIYRHLVYDYFGPNKN